MTRNPYAPFHRTWHGPHGWGPIRPSEEPTARRVGLADEPSLAHLFRKYLKMRPTAVRHGSGKTREESLHDFLFGLSER